MTPKGDLALTLFAVIWATLAVALNIMAVTAMIIAADSVGEFYEDFTSLYSPFNYVNLLAEAVLLSPALAALAWRQRRRQVRTVLRRACPPSLS